MSTDSLYSLITEAIRRAETLEELRAPGVHAAYLDISMLEEKVAEVLPAVDPEGALARRSAVRAALTARELGRAQELSERFLAELGAGAELQADLRGFLRRVRLARECAKVQPAAEQAATEAVFRGEVEWPEY